MGIVAIIPARSGSKGVPKKNIHPLAGKPLIRYTVDEARKVSLIDRIIVSTDSEEIAEAVGDPMLVPFLRPAALAADDTPDLPVFVHALDWLRAHEGFDPTIVVHLRPTSPLRTATSIARGVQTMLDHPEADAVRGVCPPTQNPFKMWRIEEGKLLPLLVCNLPEAYNQPRQKLPQVWWQNAAVDVVQCRVIRNGSMTGRVILPLIMDEIESIDIDTPLDFLVAEAILRERSNHFSAGSGLS